MRALALIILLLIIIVGGVYLYRNTASPTATTTPTGTETSTLSVAGYFGDRARTLAQADLGPRPEGVTAQTLEDAFPGLTASDFNNVATLGGKYVADADGTIRFEPQSGQASTSADMTISDVGYETLLRNLSARMNQSVNTQADIDRLLSSLNTGEHLSAKIDQGGSAFGVKVVPQSVVEDSRCPVDVTCIQAGTVKVNALVSSDATSSTASSTAQAQLFELNAPVSFAGLEITLASVTPARTSGSSISPNDYTFIFDVAR